MIAPVEAMFRLDGKLVLVTGASSGLGRHFALLLARAGASLALAARRADKLEQLAAEITALDLPGVRVQVVAMDVASRASIVRAFDDIGAGLGCPDVVINNAGVTITRPLLEQSEADWDSVMNTNLKGGWMVAQEAARRMVAAGKGGSLVNVASILGERVAGGVAPYAISKAGVVQATRALALELARHGIRANALLPGYIVTDLNREFLGSEAGQKLRARVPSRRFGELDDLSGPLLLLASDAGRHMSGATLAVDGAHLTSSL